MNELPSTEPTPTDRTRIEPSPPPKRLDALPVLYLVGFVILASALIYIWRHPSMPRTAVQDAARVTTMRDELNTTRQEAEALAARVAALEARPAAAAPSPAPNLAPNLAQLEARLAAAEARPAPPTPNFAPLEAKIAALEARKPVDVAPLDARIAALETRKPVDLGPLEAQLGALATKQAAENASLAGKLDAAGGQLAALTPRLNQIEAQAKQAADGLAAVSQRAQRFARVQAAGVALEAGQRLGDIPGAPPALAKFATEAPPTEAGLRLSFNSAADAAQKASQPALTENRPLLDRMWTRAQQSVTVRQGDNVLVGDPIAGVIAHARQLLDAGDLAGALKALDGLAGPAKAAMADWTARAQSLLDARAAVAELAARG